MRRTEATSRSASVAATATTLLALIAMAAAAPAQSGIFSVRSGMGQVALSEAMARGDAHAVRAVAAVVKAARDLLAGSQSNAVLPATLVCDALPVRSPLRPMPARPNHACEDLLAECLLDLPPPTC